MSKHCSYCGKRAYSDYCMQHKPRKAIPKQSSKELDYQQWKEQVARPAIIKRDSNVCWCCGRKAYDNEKLDLEHTKTKGSRPDLKRSLSNLRLFCRFPCHRNKTDNIPCLHKSA